jgi:phospholipid/cholesterol/gamma-HCH transport system ATP-binding protein
MCSTGSTHAGQEQHHGFVPNRGYGISKPGISASAMITSVTPEAQGQQLETAPEVIRVEGLELGYGGHALLRDMEFSIQAGEVVTVLGGSGCGKSTLLKALIGLLPPMKGRVIVGGDDITDRDPEILANARRKMGVLFQSGALLGSLTLAENVALPLKEFTGLSMEFIEAIVRIKLRQVHLEDYGHYLPAELSGGMRKRAGLARAMALDPEILFFDEPTAGLDPITAAEMDQLIVQLNGTLGTTMVVVTHELTSIFTISHRSIMLDRERQGIVAIGDPRVLRTESSDPLVRAFFKRQVTPLDRPRQEDAR